MRRVVLILAIVVAVLPARAMAANCSFSFGFASAHNSRPDVVGDCLENPSGSAIHAEQRTSNSKLIWDSAFGVWFLNPVEWWRLAGSDLVNMHGAGPGKPASVPVSAIPAPQVVTSAPSTTPNHNWVIFALGYESSLQDVYPEFGRLQGALLGLGYTMSDFVPFSYNGADIATDGTVSARPYGACDADRSIAASEGTLSSFLTGFQTTHVGRMTVVGHSLGGLLAYMLPTSSPGPFRLRTVVTIDAPLHGITSEGASGLSLFGCGSAAAEDMASMGLSVTDQRPLAGLRSWGARVATVGNDQDCTYFLNMCTGGLADLFLSGRDIRFTQWAPSDWTPSFSVWGQGITGSHSALLDDEGAMNQVANFIGPQA